MDMGKALLAATSLGIGAWAFIRLTKKKALAEAGPIGTVTEGAPVPTPTQTEPEVFPGYEWVLDTNAGGTAKLLNTWIVSAEVMVRVSDVGGVVGAEGIVKVYLSETGQFIVSVQVANPLTNSSLSATFGYAEINRAALEFSNQILRTRLATLQAGHLPSADAGAGFTETDIPYLINVTLAQLAAQEVLLTG